MAELVFVYPASGKSVPDPAAGTGARFPVDGKWTPYDNYVRRRIADGSLILEEDPPAYGPDGSTHMETLDFVRDYGGRNLGTEDVTVKIKDFLEIGGRLHFPGGDYLIVRTGADSGGVNAIIRRSTYITCDDNARFFTDDLDNDLIRLSVASNGAGLPSGWPKPRIKFHGGLFDMRNQRGSTSMPFSPTEYPPAKQGASATCDGLSIRGVYTDSGVEKNGLALAEVSGVYVLAGDHWETAGGDSGIYLDGADRFSVHDVAGQGCRDQLVYISGGSAGATGRVNVDRVIARNCFGAVSAKRSIRGGAIKSVQHYNCVLGIYLGHVTGDGNEAFIVADNYGEGAQVEVRADLCSNLSVVDNKGKNFGAMRADGVTPVVAYTPTALQFNGCTYCDIDRNGTIGVNPAYDASNPWYMTFDKYNPGSGNVLSHHNRIANNKSKGFRAIGGEAVGGGDYNRFIDNCEFTGAVPHIQKDGAHTAVRRFDWSLMAEIQQSPLLFLDGSSSAPILARFADPTSGLFFPGPGVLAVANSRLQLYSAQITAAGSDQAGATSLLASVNTITASTPGSGVRAKPATTGPQFVENRTANDVLLYPEVGERIVRSDATFADNEPWTLAAGAAALLFGASPTRLRIGAFA